MKTFKRFTASVLVCLFVLSTFTSCSGGGPGDNAGSGSQASFTAAVNANLSGTGIAFTHDDAMDAKAAKAAQALAAYLKNKNYTGEQFAQEFSESNTVSGGLTLLGLNAAIYKSCPDLLETGTTGDSVETRETITRDGRTFPAIITTTPMASDIALVVDGSDISAQAANFAAIIKHQNDPDAKFSKLGSASFSYDGYNGVLALFYCEYDIIVEIEDTTAAQ